jgi:hypothetical protein
MFATVISQPATPLPRCTSTYVCPGVINDSTPWARSTKPSILPFGAGGQAALVGLRWRAYNHPEAIATGTAEFEAPGCPLPAYECPVDHRAITITFLHAVKGGAGRWYYSRAHIAGNLAGSGIPANIAVTSGGYWD